jgi:hypothetical protein
LSTRTTLPKPNAWRSVVEDVSDIYNALDAWNGGDNITALADLASGLSSISTVVSSCAQAAGSGGSFWDDVVDAVEDVISYLCAECGVIMEDATLVINGVEIIDDWVTMYQDCSAGDDDDIVSCGAAFGDSIQRIYNVASAKALVKGEPRSKAKLVRKYRSTKKEKRCVVRSFSSWSVRKPLLGFRELLRFTDH